jgi:hypothetical protein
MNLTVLRFMHYDRVKPVYQLEEGENFLLTARIDKGESGPGYSPQITGTYKVSGSGAMNGVTFKNGTFQVSPNKKNGLYFIEVVANKKPVWLYTYTGYANKWRTHYQISFKTEKINTKGDLGVIENQLFYKSFKEEELKNYVVLTER